MESKWRREEKERKTKTKINMKRFTVNLDCEIESLFVVERVQVNNFPKLNHLKSE